MDVNSEQLIIDLLDEVVDLQQSKVRELARRIVPTATDEDLLNPHDLSELNENMHFNYEDGYLNGLISVRIAILALSKR